MKTVYTALFGDYEELKEPTIVTPGWKYICYTDQQLTSDVWRIIHVPVRDNDARRTARYYKIMFHEFIFSQYSLWLDASFAITCNLDTWWEKRFVAPISFPKHPLRNCVFREGHACIAHGRGEDPLIRKQLQKYYGKIPERAGIVTSGIMMRERTPEVIDLCERWWHELSQNSSRDQLAFAFVSMGFPVHTFKFDYSQAKEFVFTKHYNKRAK